MWCIAMCFDIIRYIRLNLQITHSHVVETLMLHYKSDLVKVIKELRLPYNIDLLARIRRDCFHQNFSDPNSLQHQQVHVRWAVFFDKFFRISSFSLWFQSENFVSSYFFCEQQIAQEAQAIFFQHTPEMAHFQPVLKHEEILFQFPPQTTNISIVQSTSAEAMVNYAPMVHTIPAQTESFVYDVESAPLLIFTPIQSPSGTQMTANDSRASDSGVEVSPHTSFSNEVSAYFYSFRSVEQIEFTVHYTRQCSMIICSWTSKRIFQFSVTFLLNKSASFVSILPSI